MKIKEAQDKFTSSLLSGEFDKEFMDNIIPGGKLTPVTCLETYLNDYRSRLGDALAEAYPTIWWVLGDEDFFELTWKYIQLHPSKSPDLGEFGELMSSFLKSHPHIKDFPFLSELANLEWDLNILFHHKPTPGLSAEDFQALGDPSEKVFQLSDSLTFFKSESPIFEMWKQGQEEKPSSDNIDWMPEQGIIFKNSRELKLLPLTSLQFEIIKRLTSGVKLSQALEDAVKEVPEFTETEISEIFSILVSEGLIQKCS